MNFYIIKRQGLCIIGRVECFYCYFKFIEVKFYIIFKKKRGFEIGILNDGFVLVLMKFKMGVVDVRLMMSCFNINLFDSCGLQCKLNQMCDWVEVINEVFMVENQQYVWWVNIFRGEGDVVDLEMDIFYNNWFQVGFEVVMQSFSFMVEVSIFRKLVVFLQIVNKLCCKRKCENYINCKKNYNIEDFIFFSEVKLLWKNLDFI